MSFDSAASRATGLIYDPLLTGLPRVRSDQRAKYSILWEAEIDQAPRFQCP